MLQVTSSGRVNVREWLSRIHRCAYDTYREAVQDHAPVDLYTPCGEDAGLVCVITLPHNVFIYVAFDPAIHQQNLLPDLCQILDKAVGSRESRIVDCTVYGRNRQTIAAVRSRGFEERGAGVEFHYSTNMPLPKVDLGPLQKRPFASAPIMPYLELLDLAFNALKLPHDWNTAPFRRDISGSSQLLLERNRNGDFAAFWKGERLVGLYYLNQNVLETIAVHPDFQNRGYGTRILYHCMHDLLVEKGFADMYLYVSTANEGALRFYRRHGFEVSAEYCRHTYIETVH